MKAGLEKAVGTLEERLIPAKEFMEKKLQEVESGDYRAEDLTEVVSREEVDPDSLVPQWDAKGTLSVRRGATRVKEPGNPEALRHRLTVLRNAWQMLSLRHTNRPELQGDYVKTFEDLKDYLLGDHVYGLHARDAEGLTLAAPPFSLVLSYEKAVRKEAAKRMNQEGTPFPAALRAAWRDPLTKERYFTTPLALVAKRPSAPPAGSREDPSTKKQRFEPKGGKGKGQGKGKQMPGCATHNKAGVPICYRFNTVGEKCKQKKCKFAHQRRKNSLAWFVRKLAKQFHSVVEVIELDLRHSRKCDFTQPKLQRKWLDFIDAGRADALVITPPCSTFSRAPWANEEGPSPLRSSQFLRGFPWNSAERKRKAQLGNILADFSFDAMGRQLRHPDKVAYMEQPEDLGKTKQDKVPGHRPGSMWQFPQHAQLAALPGVVSAALAQLDFGSDSVKPTRLLMRTPGPLHPEMYPGPPQLDDEGWYLGPLPRKSGLPLIGRQDGIFLTSAAAAWPPQLCEWVASQILTAFQQNSAAGGSQVDVDEEEDMGASQSTSRKRENRDMEESDLKRRKCEKSEDYTDPFDPPVKGGDGLPRTCTWKGSKVPFHDGGCLMSQGRWDIAKRRFPQDEEWAGLRKRLRSLIVEAAGSESKLERECFAMSRGESGCNLVKNEELRERILSAMQDFCQGEVGVLEVAEGQPFRLRLMRALLRRAGDEDCEFLGMAEEGLPVGVTHPLPRTPVAFERQVDWSLQYDPAEAYDLERANYPSAREHEEHLRKHLEEEVAEGLVERMTREQFEEEFGEARAVASLAVLVEDEALDKKRVIHDGSHGVRVNHRIRCLDKLRMPGGREKRYLLEQFQRDGSVVFSLIGDFGKAHRRFKYLRSEQGFLACRVREDENVIYVNKVGTFGISSTPYWWGRISAALLRLGHVLLGPSPIEALLYADDLETMGIGGEGRRCQVILFILLAALGSPFKWKKQRGGLATEWIGLTTDYGTYSLGLSEKRAEWLVAWIHRVCEEKLVGAREFASCLGRLGFAATALPWEKPFLGPLYTWAAAVRDQRGEVLVPWAILAILDWIAKRLREGGRMESVRAMAPAGGSPITFYTDARASEKEACIGGYLEVSSSLKDCPWFCFRVDEAMAPWLYCKGGNPKRVIAALELLGTLVAVKLWGDRGAPGMRAKVRAFTDNRGNSFAVVRGMSTKFPLTLLLMELTEELRVKDLNLDLEWISRDANTDADDLSNENWENFDPDKREMKRPEEIGWKVLDQLQVRSEELYEGIQTLKEQRSKDRTSRRPVKLLRKEKAWGSSAPPTEARTASFSSGSDDERMKKDKLRELVHNFTADALRGVECTIIERRTLTKVEAVYKLDHSVSWLKFTGRSSGATLAAVQLSWISRLISIQHLPVYEQEDFLGKSNVKDLKRSLLLSSGGDTTSAGRVPQSVTVVLKDVKEMELFLTCVEVLRLYAAMDAPV
eukprot:s15_g49.t1